MIKQTDPHAGRPAEIKSADDYKNLIDLLAVFSEADNQLSQLEVTVNEDVLQVVDEHKKDYAALQLKLVEAETALEVLARRHPDWFTLKKTIKTPYGQVSLKENPPKLETDNEEVSIVLIQSQIEAHEAKLDGTGESPLRRLLRQTTELNLETLGSLTDVELAQFRIKRTQSDTFGVKAAKLDLGKAVKEATAKTN